MKTCGRCGDQFDGRRCRACHRAATAAWDAANREKKREAAAAWYAANKERVNDRQRERKRELRADPAYVLWERMRQRERLLQRKYGISLEEYHELLERQDGGCAICGVEPADCAVLDVDHDHETGRVRGLLCNAHNRALGLFKDNAAWLQKAVDYLAQPL